MQGSGWSAPPVVPERTVASTLYLAEPEQDEPDDAQRAGEDSDRQHDLPR
jgi:hypothetical protein